MHKIKTTYGVHIFLNMYHIFNSTIYLHNDKYHYQIDLTSLKNSRNDIDGVYLNDYFNLFKEIFFDFSSNVLLDTHGEQNSMIDWVTKSCPFKNIKIKKNNYFTKYYLNLDISKPYICINTKIVNSSKYFVPGHMDDNYNFISKYNSIKTELFKILNNKNYNIILLGERSIPNCNEYNFHSNHIGNYIMYDDFKNNLNNIIDATYDDSKDGFKIENWKKTCYYLTHSKFNIYIGNGGGIHLYTCFENTIQLGVPDRLIKWIEPENIETNYYNTINCNMFLTKIKKKIFR